MNCSVSSILGLVTLVGASAISSLAAAQPAMPIQARTPPLLRMQKVVGKIAYEVRVRPGVPQPGQTVNLEVSLAQVLAAPDPAFGGRKPVANASVTAILVAPSTAAKKGRHHHAAPSWVDARLGTKLQDAGSYGFTFTPPAQKGIYGLYIRGDAGALGKLDYATTVSYGVWPIPQKAEVPALPRHLPTATRSDIAHGKELCAKMCKRNLPGALPQGKTPTFLPTAFAAPLTDAALLGKVVGPQAAQLTAMERTDLVHYLRGLQFHVRDFYPNAAAFTTNRFTINKYGLDRLKKSAGITLKGDAASGVVFVVYKGKADPAGPERIAYSNRVARARLKKSDKIGYIIFTEAPGLRQVQELGLALKLEPTYSIVGALTRTATGEIDRHLDRELHAFVGHGKFNDPRSLRRGPSSLRKKITPIYLKDAELATMYYGDERNFTAFDNAFK